MRIIANNDSHATVLRVMSLPIRSDYVVHLPFRISRTTETGVTTARKAIHIFNLLNSFNR